MIRRAGRDDAEAFHEAWESGTPTSGEVADLVSAAEALCRSAVVQPRPELCLGVNRKTKNDKKSKNR